MSFPVCKFFRSEQGCKFGNKCRYKHSDTSHFPAFDQSDHRQNRDDGAVRRFYSEGTSFSQEYYSASGEHEASVRNARYRPTENFPFHSYQRGASDHYGDLVRPIPRTAEANLEERFQELDTTDQDGAVQSGFHPHLQQQRPPKQICHYFARNGNCCFGSRCRFEHAQPNAVPPRFQQEQNGPRSYQGRSSAVPSDDQAGREKNQVRYSRYPNEGISRKAATPSKTGSAATFESGQAPRQSRAKQYAESDPDQKGTESRNDEEKKQVPQTGIKSDKICQFFVRGWCWKGRRCRFLHPRHQVASAKEAVSEAQHEEQEEKSTTSSPPEEQKEGCASTSSQTTPAENRDVELSSKPPGVQKPKATPKPRPPYVPQGTKKYRRDEVDDVEGSRLRRTEIDQLVKRFPKNKVKVIRDCAEFFQCVINFSPTDPDWPFDVKIFQLQVDIPSDYPFEMMTITLPAEQDLPETVRRYMEVSIEEWLDDKEKQLAGSGQVELVFRPFLRWLDRNIEDVVTEGLKQLKRELVAKSAGLQFISAKELQKQYPGPSSGHLEDEDSEGGDRDDDNDDDETDSESQDEEDTSSDYEESGEEGDPGSIDEEKTEEERNKSKERKSQQDKAKAMMAEPERRGTEISLKNLQLKESTATLYFEKICLLIHCERCKHTSEFMASPGRVNMVQCGQCSQTQTAVYRPAMAHHFSPVVGYLDLDACLPYDVILQNCNTMIACMNCSKDTKSKAVIAGQPMDHWCRVCHHKLRVSTDGVRFTLLESSKTPLSLKGLVKVVVPTRKRLPKDPAIQEGKPLPNFGTCKHYKKSYRWLRFPCCGKTYPCDVCHDSKEDHEMAFANRMICGFCCKEQPYAVDRPCKGCDMNLTRVHTKHWEGGQGCRDKISMCRDDKQKYRNSNKTTSKHSQKVKDMQSKKRTKLRHV